MMYRIKPLEWKNKTDEITTTDLSELYESSTPISTFDIQKMQSGDWYYRFCFDEYYDDGGGLCEGLEDGKKICEKIWGNRLKKCLVEEKEN